ncbi:MAG: sugar nucleotide-binding protein [Silvanigrellales bacterium]|nr:sugar nucleotide-binding protein [Silvanigrellales bacterium]
MKALPGVARPDAAWRPSVQTPVELWVGPECSMTRVRDTYKDQIALTGHDKRDEDVDLFAAMGASAVRYPVLWERTAPVWGESPRWEFADRRLARLRSLGLRPIVGLLHHGSGPSYTSLLDAQFPKKLAAFAALVAERFPWVDAYTPVNEPLTTARFSGLYGLWYPHGNDDATFARCLFNQCRGVVEAMHAIRRVNPFAKLVQTEDLGRVRSTPLLAYQASFENERRWLTYDLLCGRVNEQHPLWSSLVLSGLTPRELDTFQADPCPPDVFGVNHYITSDRFLDERLERYPVRIHGGNGRHAYADTEAVRVEVVPEPHRFARVLTETYDRYHSFLPDSGVALTEVHLACSREEQFRWLREAWCDVEFCRKAGVDVRALTVWSVFGAFDWNSLLTRNEGAYETGVFDVRGSSLRATALAPLVATLAKPEGRTLNSIDKETTSESNAVCGGAPVFEEKGWWHRPERLVFQSRRFNPSHLSNVLRSVVPARGRGRPVLITGATGRLGSAFARVCALRGLPYRVLTRSELDIASEEDARNVLAATSPWLVVNAAGYGRVDKAESDVAMCLRENTQGPAVLARACARKGIRFLTFSSDLVFDGAEAEPYVECDVTRPLSVYGRSKSLGEHDVLEAHPGALIIRSGAFFGPWDDTHFLAAALARLRCEGETPVEAFDGHTLSPTYVPDVVNVALDLGLDGERGIVHLANNGAVTWYAFLHLAAGMAGLSRSRLQPCAALDLGWCAPRPRHSVLCSNRGVGLPTLGDALSRYLEETTFNEHRRLKEGV